MTVPKYTCICTKHLKSILPLGKPSIYTIGASKTTLISVLSEFYKPIQGTAWIAGLELLVQVICPCSHCIHRSHFHSSYEFCFCIRCSDVGHPSPPRGVSLVQRPISRAVGQRAPAVYTRFKGVKWKKESLYSSVPSNR